MSGEPMSFSSHGEALPGQPPCSGANDSALLSVPTKEPAMALSRVQLSVLALVAAVLLAHSNIDTRAHAQARATAGNAITGEGFPNPAPVVTRNWGSFPLVASGGRLPASTSIPSTATSGPTSAAARARPAAVRSTATTH